MAFQECPTPDASALAINDIDNHAYRYMGDLEDCRLESEMIVITSDDRNSAIHQAAYGTYRELDATLPFFRLHTLGNRPSEIIQNQRRKALGTYATAILLKKILSDSIENTENALISGDAGTILDRPLGPDIDYFEHRIHLVSYRSNELFGTQTAPEQWYKDAEAGLYVRRVMKPEPSSDFRHFERTLSFLIDWKQLETLYPHLETRQ